MYIRTPSQCVSILKQARIDKELTQAELGALVGLSQKRIAMIENLKASPRLEEFLKLVSTLGLNLKIESSNQKQKSKINLVWE